MIDVAGIDLTIIVPLFYYLNVCFCLMPTLLPMLIPSFERTVALLHTCLGLLWLELVFSFQAILIVYKIMPQH
jgi:hypothetical protein